MPDTKEKSNKSKQEHFDWSTNYDLVELSRSTYKGLGRLEKYLRKLLGPGADTLESLDYPDRATTLISWLISINNESVPDALGTMTIEQSQQRVRDLIRYLMWVTRMQSEAQFFDVAVEALLLSDSRRDKAAAKIMREHGLEELAQHYDGCVRMKTEFAAEQLQDIFPLILAGLRTAVQLLADTDPEDIIRGRQSLKQARDASKAPKFSQALQAATNSAYTPEMIEEECWQRLLLLDGMEFEVKGTGYRFQRDGEELVYAVNMTTGNERGIRRSSFYPYFKRSRSQQRP